MRVCLVALLCLLGVAARAETATVAVASNFAIPMADLVARFEQATGHRIRTSTASTGVLYAAIVNGARYTALLAADAERPRKLEADGLGIAGSRFTYAVGRLELWSVDPELSGADCRQQLDDLGKRRLAIANPLTAPYGAASRAFLETAGLWDRVEPNLVYGQNIAQTLHFVVTGNASLGLVARAQAASDRVPGATCRWTVPSSLHEPIVQQAVLLQPGAGNIAAEAFLDFLQTDGARALIRSHGYEVAN
jgi:molybdate transport system substrate-binding protein